MNDIVSTAATAHSPAVRQLYGKIAVGASSRDADRAHPHQALSLPRQARFGALSLQVAKGGGGRTLCDVIEEAIYLAEADSHVANIFRNRFTFVERFPFGSTDRRRQGLAADRAGRRDRSVGQSLRDAQPRGGSLTRIACRTETRRKQKYGSRHNQYR